MYAIPLSELSGYSIGNNKWQTSVIWYIVLIRANVFSNFSSLLVSSYGKEGS